MKKTLLISGFILLGSANLIFNQTSASDEPTICTMEYRPVCASVEVQCIKAPCDPIQETFGNSCAMRANKHATYLYDGECKTNPLADTKWNLYSFNGELATGADMTFENDRLSARVCNTFNGAYTLEGNTFVVGPMMSTKMACMGDLAKYESAFDLSGATYLLTMDDANQMRIETAAGDIFEWNRSTPIIGMPNPASLNCTNNGGTLNILEGNNGQYGMCTLADGSQCEEWAYYRGECNPTSDKLQNVLNSYLAVVRFTEDGYKQFFVDLKSKIDIGLAKANGATRKAYIQIANFLKNY